jgi:hypothetical protein
VAKANASAIDWRHNRPPRRAREILKHYLENPHTADTLEGIAAWRLIEDIVRERVREVHEALEWLVAQRYLKRTAGRGAAPPLYTLNDERRTESQRLIARGRLRRPRGRGTT